MRIKARGRCWCFTLNNFQDDEVAALRDLQRNGVVRYLVLQQEIGDGTKSHTPLGTPHLQGYVELFRPMLMTGVKKIVGVRAHLEQRFGTQAEAIEYSKKDDTRVANGITIEFGTPARSKCSVDLLNSVINGASLRDLAMDYPRQFLAQGKKIAYMKDVIVEPRDWAMNIVILWGPTGTGKTYFAWKRWPDAYSVSHPVGKNWWWENYDGEETVILDEFAEQITLQLLLRFLDRTPFRVWNKGGSSQFVSKRIVICTNFDPFYWYADAKQVGRDAMMRRLAEYATVYKLEERFRGVGMPCVEYDDRFEEDESDSDSESDSDDPARDWDV